MDFNKESKEKKSMNTPQIKMPWPKRPTKPNPYKKKQVNEKSSWDDENLKMPWPKRPTMTNKKKQELKSSWEEEDLTDIPPVKQKEEVFEDPVAKRKEVKREKKTKTPKRYGWNNFEDNKNDDQEIENSDIMQTKPTLKRK